jgi:sugar phosphate isomerase/epimerase
MQPVTFPSDRPAAVRCNARGPLARRDFLRGLWGGATVAAAGLVPARARAAEATDVPAEWQLGCYTRPFDAHDYRTALDAIAEAGFTYAGLMTAKGESWVLITASTAPETADRMATDLKQRGLRCASVYGDYTPTAEVAANVRALERLVAHTAACGSPDLLLGGVGDVSLQEPYYRAIREVCDLAASKGVRLTIKPHGGQIATGPQCRQAIERVGHRNFRLWYDPGNIYYYSDGERDPVADAATVDGLVVGMSAKDFLPPKEVLVTPGTGRVDFPRVFARLRQGGFRRGPVLVETLAKGSLVQVTAEARKARLFLTELLRRGGQE